MKNKIKFVVVVLLILLAGSLYSTEIKKLPQLVYPKNLEVKNDRILITDFPDIYLYTIKNFKLIKKFGNRGEGPGEFTIDQIVMDWKLAGLRSDISENCILVNSQGRLSFFDLNGEFLKMKKVQSERGWSCFKTIKNNFVASERIRKGNDMFFSIKTYDNNLKEIREITRYPFWIRNRNYLKSSGYDFFERANGTLSFVTESGLIYISRNNSPEVHIDIFNPEGKLLKTINYKTEKVRIAESFIKEVYKHYRLKFKLGYDSNVKMTTFPVNFPGLRKFFVDKGEIYIITYKRESDQNEFIVLDQNGKFVKKRMLPVIEANPDHLYPCTVHNGFFYQIVEVEEDEEWELHITRI